MDCPLAVVWFGQLRQCRRREGRKRVKLRFITPAPFLPVAVGWLQPLLKAASSVSYPLLA